MAPSQLKVGTGLSAVPMAAKQLRSFAKQTYPYGHGVPLQSLAHGATAQVNIGMVYRITSDTVDTRTNNGITSANNLQYQTNTKNKYMLSNNDILKKLRVALSLRNDDIVEILALANFTITKGALGDFFRNEDHPNYVVACDQVLRNFLNGLIIYKRGPMPDNKADGKAGG